MGEPHVDPRHLTYLIVQHDEYPKGADGKTPDLTQEPRVALHIHIANRHNGRGKRLEVYFDKRDQPRLRALQNYLAASNGFLSANWIHRPSSEHPRTKSEFLEGLEAELMRQVAAGKITTRSHTVKALEQMGYPLTRRSDQGVSIRHPDFGPIRLKGLLYSVGGPEEMWKHPATTESGSIIAKPDVTVAELYARWEKASARKLAFNLRCYGERSEIHGRETFEQSATPQQRKTYDTLSELSPYYRRLPDALRAASDELFDTPLDAAFPPLVSRRARMALAASREEKQLIAALMRMNEFHAERIAEIIGGLRQAQREAVKQAAIDRAAYAASQPTSPVQVDPAQQTPEAPSRPQPDTHAKPQPKTYDFDR